MLKTILLALTWLVFFEGKMPEYNFSRKTSAEDLKCSLPSPQNFKWSVIGSTYIFFRWDPVPGAAYYRVKIFNSPSKTMLYSRLVTALPQNNGVAANGLIPGNSYSVEVSSVCSNGIVSPKP